MADNSLSKRAEPQFQYANSTKKNKASASSILFILFMIAFFMGISFLVEQAGFDKETTKILTAVATLGAGLILVTACATIGFIPLVLSTNGHTKLAQRLALFNAKFMDIIFPHSSESALLYMTVSNVARNNGDYETAQKFGSKAIEESISSQQSLMEIREKASHRKSSSTVAIGVSLSRDKAFKIPEAKLVQGWNYFDLGKLEVAEQLASESIDGMISAIAHETNPKVEWDKSEPKTISDRLNFNITEKMAEHSGDLTMKMLMPQNFAMLANAYDLLALIAAKKGDANLCKKYLRNSHDALAQKQLQDSDHMVNHLDNSAYANLLLNDPRVAKKEVETALELAKKHKPSQTLRSSLLTVLGESYSQLNMKQEAEETLTSALALRLKLYPKDHPYVKQTQMFLSAFYKKLGRHECLDARLGL